VSYSEENFTSHVDGQKDYNWVLRKAGTEPFLLQSVNKIQLSYMVMRYRKMETAWINKQEVKVI